MDELVTESGVSLDLKEGIPIPLSLAIADFKEPEKRQRNFSKEIDIPGTAKNQKFFASAFNLTQVGGVYDFNSSAKINCTYYKRGTPVLRNAVIKLNKVIITDGVPLFKVGLFADFVDIFLLLSNMNVSDLDWSAYTHLLTNTNIQNSWATPAGTGYYYPLIERRQRTTITQWKNTDLIPYVHLVDVFKKCMAVVDQKFTSVHLDKTLIKNILFGYGGGNYVDNSITPAEQNNRKVLTNNGVINFAQTAGINPVEENNTPQVSGTVYYSQFSLSQPLLTTGVPVLTLTEVQDIYGQFSPNTFTAQRTGAYKVTLTGSFRQRYTGAYTYASGGSATLWYLKNGSATPLVNLNQTSADQTFVINQAFNVDLNQGDTVQFVFGSTNVTFTNGTVTTAITRTVTAPTPISLTFQSLETSLVEGSTVELSRMLPTMKCSDFVLGVIRLFNLMISDPDIYGVVRIEPMADFYQGTNVFTDITEEVDNSREIEIRPSANEYAKKLMYLWKEGTETDAKNFKSKWGVGYGNLTFDQASFFAKGEQKIELPFANIIPYQVTPNLLVPRFVDIDNAGVKKTTSGIPRLMFRNGLKPGNWQLVGSTTNSYTTYPCVHHFDNWQSPNFDLNWKLVEEVYYAATAVTTINSYSVYYDEFVNEIIDKEGKYVQLYRKMNNSQVRNLDWSKLLMLNGALFRFNKVVDFDSEMTEVTKIEMIKVLEAKNAGRGKILNPAPKLPSIYTKVISSPNNNVGTGVSVISGGKGKQVLSLSKVIQG